MAQESPTAVDQDSAISVRLQLKRWKETLLYTKEISVFTEVSTILAALLGREI